MQSSQSRRVRLLRYQSKPSLGTGAEVLFDASADIHLLLDDLRWLSELPDAEPDFFVLAMLDTCSLKMLRSLAIDAAARGLAGKLCISISHGRRPDDATLAALQEGQLRVLLSGIGADARFSELADSFIDGIVIDGSLIAAALGDPGAASVLEAISTLAKNLGLRTFANRCAGPDEVDMAVSCGVDFLTLAVDSPPDMTLGFAISPASDDMPNVA